MSDPIKWWDVVPAGATLARIDPKYGQAVFEYDHKIGRLTVTIDLFTDEVTSMATYG